MTSDAPHSAAALPALPFRLSVLDKSPVAPGETAVEALARSVSLARFADDAGYHRYWLAEHHNTAALACPSPEILIAHVLAHTRRIRVGSGGVMLQHYSPYKIAENFNLLASLAPDRVDLGIGKAPGGLPLSTRALQAGYDPAQRASFAELAAELKRHLDGSGTPPDDAGHTDATLHATPFPPVAAQPFLLGASAESAALAAQLVQQAAKRTAARTGAAAKGTAQHLVQAAARRTAGVVAQQVVQQAAAGLALAGTPAMLVVHHRADPLGQHHAGGDLGQASHQAHANPPCGWART